MAVSDRFARGPQPLSSYGERRCPDSLLIDLPLPYSEESLLQIEPSLSSASSVFVLDSGSIRRIVRDAFLDVADRRAEQFTKP